MDYVSSNHDRPDWGERYLLCFGACCSDTRHWKGGFAYLGLPAHICWRDGPPHGLSSFADQLHHRCIETMPSSSVLRRLAWVMLRTAAVCCSLALMRCDEQRLISTELASSSSRSCWRARTASYGRSLVWRMFEHYVLEFLSYSVQSFHADHSASARNRCSLNSH